MKLDHTAIEFLSVCDSPRGYRSYLYAVRELPSKKQIGSCCLRFETKEGALLTLGNIGYETDEDARRRGHATNACLMLIDEAKRLGLSRLYICCAEDNAASVGICRKLGAAEESDDGDKQKKIRRFRLL